MKIFGLLAFVGSLAALFFIERADPASNAFWMLDVGSLLLTAFAPIGLVMMCTDWGSLSRALSSVFGPSLEQRQRSSDRDSLFLHKIRIAYTLDGPRVFETVKAKGLTEPVMKIIDRFAARMPRAEVLELMENERDRKNHRLLQSVKALNLGVRLAVPIGMLGTVFGIIQVLLVLPDVSHIGVDMGRALLCTFYGLLFSLILWTPLQQRVERVLDTQGEAYDRLVRWLRFLDGEGLGADEGSKSGGDENPPVVTSQRREAANVAEHIQTTSPHYLSEVPDVVDFNMLAMLMLFVGVTAFAFVFPQLRDSDLTRAAVSGRDVVAPVNPFDAVNLSFSRWAENEKLPAQITVSQEIDSVSVEFVDGILFAPNAVELSPNGLAMMQRLSGSLEGLPSRFRIRIEGHARGNPGAAIRDSWEHTSRKALTVLYSLGLSPKALKQTSTAAYSDSKSRNVVTVRIY